MKAAGALAAALALAAACMLPWHEPDRAYALDASTTVMVVTDPDATLAPKITFVSGDLAGSVDEVRGQEIRVSAEGDEPLTYSWARSIDGVPDPSFGDSGSSICSLADIVGNGDYRYTVTVTDGAGRFASAAVRVFVSGDYERTPLLDSATGVMVAGSHHKDARLVVSLLSVGERGHELLRAAADGRDLTCAYRLAIEGVPSGMQAVVGELHVSVPFGAAVRTYSLRAASFEAQEVLFLPEGGASVVALDGRKANGRVAFEAPTLGSFGIAGDEQGGDEPGGDEPGDGESSEEGGGGSDGGSATPGADDDGAGSAGRVSPLPTPDPSSLASTGDAAGIASAAFAALVLVAVAAVRLAGTRRPADEK